MNKKGQAAIVLLIVLLVVIGAVLVILFFRGNLGNITGRIIYDNRECRTERVPYESVEEYPETVPYTERICISDEYDADAGYIEDGREISWSSRQSLFDSDGDPIVNRTRRYFIENFEDESGRFRIIANYFDSNNRMIDSFVYDRVSIRGDDREEGTISYRILWENKPGRARSFNLELDSPDLQSCDFVTKYRTVIKTRKTVLYRNEEVCNGNRY